jgi:hypothetical protein
MRGVGEGVGDGVGDAPGMGVGEDGGDGSGEGVAGTAVIARGGSVGVRWATGVAGVPARSRLHPITSRARTTRDSTARGRRFTAR